VGVIDIVGSIVWRTIRCMGRMIGASMTPVDYLAGKESGL
jgi:hypothetical protein